MIDFIWTLLEVFIVGASIGLLIVLVIAKLLDLLD